MDKHRRIKMINRVILVGRLTKEPELKRNATGTAYLNTSIAINDKYKEEEKTYYINVVMFNKTAEIVAQYGTKGMLLGVDGKITTRSYEKDGQKVYVTEVLAERIELLDSKKSADLQPSPRSEKLNSGARPVADAKKYETDDDLPF
jgi:single-strand DNA-binding protein